MRKESRHVCIDHRAPGLSNRTLHHVHGSTDLVRTIGGDHAPAPGHWEIGSGQRLDLAARGLRTRALLAHVSCGTLTVTDDLLGSVLDFTVLVPDTNGSARFSTWVSSFVSVDSWQADGTTTTASGSRPVSLRLRNNGVVPPAGEGAIVSGVTVEGHRRPPRAQQRRSGAGGRAVEARRRAESPPAVAELNLNR